MVDHRIHDLTEIFTGARILKSSILNKINEVKKSSFNLPLDSKNFAKVLSGGFCLNKKYLI